jgi:SRSO17 transposase
MNQCSQTRISRGFTLIVDDSGHRKSGNLQPEWDGNTLEKLGKPITGIVLVTTHLYDGKKSLPLDIELYQHANSLPQGKKDIEFKKKARVSLSFN